MSKFVNLDDSKNTVTITVGGEEFEIKKVVLSVHMLYGEYMKKTGAFLAKVKENTTDESDLVEEYVQLKSSYIDRLMEKLLVKNGYEYDQDWWAENVESYQEMEQFIVEALRKDVTDDKKKDSQESLTITE